jgi:hypothetical protein
MWPGAPEELWAVFDTYDVTDAEINKITHENAMKLYHFEPFAHVPKDQATVGALRKAAEGHDVAVRALSHARTGEKTSVSDWTANLEKATASQK